MTYIAYDYNSKVISIVVATNIKLATAYWQGADIPVHSTKCVEEDFTKLEDHPTGVFPILKTEEKDSYQLRDMKIGSKVIIVK